MRRTNNGQCDCHTRAWTPGCFDTGRVVSLVACLGKQGRLEADPHARVLAQRLVRLEAQGLGADGSRDMEDVLDQARRIMAGLQRRKLMRLAHKPKGRKAQNRAM